LGLVTIKTSGIEALACDWCSRRESQFGFGLGGYINLTQPTERKKKNGTVIPTGEGSLSFQTKRAVYGVLSLLEACKYMKLKRKSYTGKRTLLEKHPHQHRERCQTEDAGR